MSWSEVKKINSDITTPLNEGGVKIVKSVQKGYAAYSSGGTTISISAVTVAKSLVIIDGLFQLGKSATDGGNHRLPYIKAFSATSITLSTSNPPSSNVNNGMVSWQVIEFY